MSHYPSNYQDCRNFDDFQARALERMEAIEQRAIERTLDNATTGELVLMNRDLALARAENVARDHDHAEANAEVMS